MSNGTEDVTAVFDDLGDLEKQFADVELDAMRRKEFALQPLYNKRTALLSRIPDFWSTVFGNGPEQVQQFLAPADLGLIASIQSFTVERHQIESATKGEPRSLRFTFEFAENEFIGDKTLVKEFEYKSHGDGPGSLVSKPVPIKWKSKKQDVTNGLLDLAVELYAAEEALSLKNGDQVIDVVEREALWQHEKLRDKLIQLDESEDAEPPSFFNWFGFRGPVDLEASPKKSAENGANGTNDKEDDEDDEDDFADQNLEVEIFPAGEEVALMLAEELWTDAMDYFMSAQEEAPFDANGLDFDETDEDDEEEGDEDDDDAPELVPAEEDHPRKRQRKD